MKIHLYYDGENQPTYFSTNEIVLASDVDDYQWRHLRTLIDFGIFSNNLRYTSNTDVESKRKSFGPGTAFFRWTEKNLEKYYRENSDGTVSQTPENARFRFGGSNLITYENRQYKIAYTSGNRKLLTLSPMTEINGNRNIPTSLLELLKETLIMADDPRNRTNVNNRDKKLEYV